MIKDERPPHFSSPTESSGSANQRRWVPPSQKRNVVNTEERDNAIFRKVRGILNKLTPEKFDKLSLELLNIGIESIHILKGIILLIFEKALDEPKYSSLYAQLCHRLCEDSPNFEASSSKITSFKRLLLNKCQDEFENRSRAFEAFDKDVLTPDEEEQEHIAKHKMLGNIKFIGELGKLDMLHEGILHRCIQQLLEKKKKNTPVEDLGEDYECLCQILKTTGKSLDHDKARLWMDQYFDRIKTIMSNPELPSRIRFMLLDIVELRSSNWNPRKIYKDTGPKTIQQVRMEAMKEYSVAVPNVQMSNLSMNTTDMFGRPINGTIGPSKSMMGDIFGPMSPPFMGSHSGIGTGPGVVDDFTPSFLNSNPRHKIQFDPDYKGQYGGGRGKPQDNKGRNSPRFDRYSNNSSPSYHREKEADIDQDDVHEDYGMRQNRDGGYNNRYNNRDNRGQGQRSYYNRNQQNKEYRSQDGSLQPRFPTRQRSPYNLEEQGNRSRDNHSPGNNSWRDKRDDREPRDEQWNDNRNAHNGNRSTPPYRGSYDRDNAQRREGSPPNQDGRDWGRGHEPRRDNWEKNHSDRENDRDKTGKDNRDQWERDNREKRDRDFPKVIKRDELEARSRAQNDRSRDWDAFDGDRREPYNSDFQKGGYDRRENQDRDFRNGDIGEPKEKNRFGNEIDFRPREGTAFNNHGDNRGGDFHHNNGDFRDFRDNRENRDFRDFRDNREHHEYRDNRGGFRDFGDRGGFDRDHRQGGGFQKGRENQQQAVQRELPPRFQRKQMQQQQATPDPLFSSESPTPPCPPDDPVPIMSGMPPMPGMHPGAPPQRFRHPLHTGQGPPHPGFFPPRFPPPGGPPMRGPPPPRGFPIGPPPHMPHPRYPMGSQNEGRSMDRDQSSPRDGGILTPGGPGQSPPHNLPKGPAKVDEISLRPARNFPTMLRPSAPSMLPKSAQSPYSAPISSMNQIPIGPDLLGPGPGGPQPTMKPTNLTIKQVHAPEKHKDKKKVPNKEELKKATDELLKTFVEGGDVDQAVKTVKDMRPPRRFMPEMISMLIVAGLERGDQERENISSLILSMKEESILASDLYLDGLSLVLDRMSELEQEIPLVKSNVAKFAAQAVSGDIISLSNLAEPLHNGAHYPFFLLCLQQLHKVRDKEWLVKSFNDSRIELLSMLPECDRTKERMIDILEDRNLSFMFPLLRVQSDLWRVIRSDPNPTNVYKWIKENVETNLHTDAGFIDILVTNVLKYVTSESTMKDDQDANNPEKAAVDKESHLIDKFKGVLARFLLDRVDLQLTAIYAMQVFGHSVHFPKGLMLRLFMNMYDLEIIDEESFLKWKEEVNDEFPGKGQVLFQVHQWLTWLEQAEEESEEEEN